MALSLTRYSSKGLLIKEIKKDINFRIMKNTFKEKDSIVDFDNLFNCNLQSISSSKQISIYSFLFSIDLTKLFTGTEINKPFDCHFYKGNMAWISVEDNHYRYFSRSFNRVVISFDLIDISKAYFDIENDFEVLNFLLNKLNLVNINSFWRKTQFDKYSENIEMLKSLSKIKKAYPHFYKLIYSHKDTLVFLNKYANKNLICQSISYNRDALFFISASYVGSELVISRSKASKVLNFLSLIGIVRKVPLNQIPRDMLEKSISYKKDKGNKDIINYYTLINMKTEIDNLEEFSKEILNTPIRYSNISKENVKEALGDKYLNRLII